MITKIKPDKQKSVSLRKMAEITLERLEETDKEKYPSNTLTDYYDVMHKLLEAISIAEGIKIKGEGAHQELIDYIAKHHGLDEQIRQFLQQMREYRNLISYEGFVIHRNFVVLNEEKMKRIVKKLFELLEG